MNASSDPPVAPPMLRAILGHGGSDLSDDDLQLVRFVQDVLGANAMGACDDLSLRLAQDIVALYGRYDAARIVRALPQMRVRANSWLRARGENSPMRIRSGLSGKDVHAQGRRIPYLDFFAMQEHDLSFTRFDGSQSETVKRAAFVSGDAVTVLPYDPKRDVVYLVEQFRYGPYARGDRNPWSLEPIAGRIDPGEEPETAARRETQEEAGLNVEKLWPIANYYPSPGAVTEYLFSYIGIADLSADKAVIGGLDDEAEDIRGHIIGFDALMALLDSGEAQNGPLILSALWLSAQRGKLRQGS